MIRAPHAAALACLLAAAPLRGDGGLLRVNQIAGPFRIAVFTAPTPLRVGTADVSVLVQRAGDEAPILDAEVAVTLRAGAREIAAPATRAAATNKLLYATLIEVPAPGAWTLTVHARAGGAEGTVSSVVDVAPPLGTAWTYWPYLALPAVLIALFAIHQRLRARQRGE